LTSFYKQTLLADHVALAVTHCDSIQKNVMHVLI